MIALALRLATADRLRVAILGMVALAIATGTAVLGVAFGLVPALQDRADRTAWMHASFSPVVLDVDSEQTHTRMANATDFFGDRRIEVVTLRGVGDDPPLPPTLGSLPAPGDVLVSPALRRMMAAHPVLAGRYGDVVGTLDDGALAGPDQLLAVRGGSADEVASTALPVSAFADHAPSVMRSGPVQQVSVTVRLVVLLGAVAFVVPVFFFIVSATRLSSASRTELLANLRLAGASTGQVHALAAVETLLASAAGIVLGIVLFLLIRPLASHLSPDGRFFPHELAPGAVGWLVIVLGVPLAALVVSQATLADVASSPLQTSRRVVAPRASGWRALPLLATVALVGYVLRTRLRPAATTDGDWLVVASFALLLAALVYAAPWLVRATGLVMARRRSPALLLAGRHLANDPHGGYRAISSVVLATLVTTLFVAASPAARAALRTVEDVGQSAGTAHVVVPSAGSASAVRLVEELRDSDGVLDAALVAEAATSTNRGPVRVWVGDCAEMTAAAGMPDVPCDRSPVVVSSDSTSALSGRPEVIDLFSLPTSLRAVDTTETDPAASERITLRPSGTATMAPAAGDDMPSVLISDGVLEEAEGTMRPTLVVVRYRDAAALEEVRTLALRASPHNLVTTRDSALAVRDGGERTLYQSLAIAVLGSFGIAGAALVIACAVALLERRRSFSMLRLTGSPVRLLRRTLVLEHCLVLGVLALVAAVLGGLVGRWTAPAGAPVPGSALAVALPFGVGMVMALFVAGAMLPLVGRLTRTEQTRFD